MRHTIHEEYFNRENWSAYTVIWYICKTMVRCTRWNKQIRLRTGKKKKDAWLLIIYSMFGNNVIERGCRSIGRSFA